MKTAVILLAHGTPDVDASKPVHEYAAALAKVSGMKVEPCMREFIEPSIPSVTKKLAGEGIERVLVIPFFLFKSGHVTRDITNDLEAEKQKYPHLRFDVADPIGFDPAVVNILKARLEAIR